jgi:polyisoprenyl-teichoic acid--peptidoglycan teichoic acid transferase
VLLLVMGGGVAIIGTRVFATVAFHSVHQQNLLGDSGQQAVTKGHVEITGAKTILMIGVDSRPGQDVRDLVRADSIIIAQIPPTHDAAYLVSIPRDTMVRIPAYTNGTKRYGGGSDKINAAYAYGGDGLTGSAAKNHAVELLAKTIKQDYGVVCDAAVIVDFDGFRSVVRTLGGVDMYVDEETTSVHIGFTRDGKVKVPYRQAQRADGGTDLIPVAGVTPQRYHVGQQHLTPDQALDYVRQRETLANGDYDRQRHQQQFIKAMLKQVMSANTLANPVKLAQIIDSMGKAMTFDNGGIALEDWVYAMKGVGSNITTIKTNNGTYHSAGASSSAEALDQTTLALLAAVKDDSVAAFVAAHPNLVTQS